MIVCFLAVYCIVCLLIRGVPLFRFVFIAVFCIVAIVEVSINIEDTGFSTSSRTNYVSDNAAIHELINKTDEGFYRIEKDTRRTKNDGAWNSYKSASIFSSTTLKPLSSFYKKFGMQGGTNSFAFYGASPLMAQFLDVKYILSDEEINDPLLSLKATADSNYLDEPSGYLYEYNFDTSLGYLVSEDFMDKFDSSINNPFLAQNNFAGACIGANNIFDYSEHIYGEEINIEVTKDGRGFIFVEDKISDVSVQILRDDIILKNKKFSSIENARLLDIGDVEAGDTLKVMTSDSEHKRFGVIPGVMDYDTFYKAANCLSDGAICVLDYSGNFVKAKVDVKDEKRAMLLTSIPADKGWSVFVDGKKSNFYSFEEAFLTVPLSKGEHLVEFRYSAPGLLAGAIISIIAILALIIKRIYCKIQKFE